MKLTGLQRESDPQATLPTRHRGLPSLLLLTYLCFRFYTSSTFRPQHVIHSVLCTRVLLFILRSRRSSSSDPATTTISSYHLPVTLTQKFTAVFSTVWGGDDSNDGMIDDDVLKIWSEEDSGRDGDVESIGRPSTGEQSLGQRRSSVIGGG